MNQRTEIKYLRNVDLFVVIIGFQSDVVLNVRASSLARRVLVSTDRDEELRRLAKTKEHSLSLLSDRSLYKLYGKR